MRSRKEQRNIESQPGCPRGDTPTMSLIYLNPFASRKIVKETRHGVSLRWWKVIAIETQDFASLRHQIQKFTNNSLIIFPFGVMLSKS